MKRWSSASAMPAFSLPVRAGAGLIPDLVEWEIRKAVPINACQARIIR
jgi:hypothetical protein